MKIFTEILKATPINFIVSYFSFIVQANYKICVEVFEKTINCTEMIDHSFERKLYGACHRLC